MSQASLKMQDVRVHFPVAGGQVDVLKGVDFTAYPGERIGIVGSSGAGKTTLMMVAAGLQRPSQGSVEVGGKNFADLDERAMTRLRADYIGIVFQNFHLIASMTALENVMIPLEFAGQARADIQAEAALVQIGLGHRMNHYPGALSGGEQQRVALARALVRAPALLLADEPTGNLDAENGRAIIDALFALSAEKATTLLLITHDRGIAARCDRRLQMQDGLVEDADP